MGYGRVKVMRSFISRSIQLCVNVLSYARMPYYSIQLHSLSHYLQIEMKLIFLAIPRNVKLLYQWRYAYEYLKYLNVIHDYTHIHSPYRRHATFNIMFVHRHRWFHFHSHLAPSVSLLLLFLHKRNMKELVKSSVREDLIVQGKWRSHKVRILKIFSSLFSSINVNDLMVIMILTLKLEIKRNCVCMIIKMYNKPIHMSNNRVISVLLNISQNVMKDISVHGLNHSLK